MNLTTFRKRMTPPAFTFAQAQIVAHDMSRQALRLALHRWAARGEIVRIRRGVYAFPDRPVALPQMIELLYPPAYISLESALNQHGLLPDVPFEMTLITTRPTRAFETPWGRFRFHHVQRPLFTGFDPQTRLATPEKALLDWIYFRGARFANTPEFWRETRLDNLGGLRWKQADSWSRLYPRESVRTLWRGLKRYAKTS